ncbi:MAG TPA: DUF4157 domain-containing protein, partial [Methylibium sp.]|nr:DUF4157 domain-containing protein [Methylibium sp.]
YAPGTPEGRGLLAHELTHVLQQRRHGTPAEQPSGVADGGARRVPAGGDAAEREAELNAQRVHGGAPLSASERPREPVQRGLLGRIGGTLGDAAGWVGDRASDAYDSAADLAGDAAEWVGDRLRDAALAIVRRVAPGLEPLIEDGPIGWLGRKLGGVFESITDTLVALNPLTLVRRLASTFAVLVERAAAIVAALASGDCQPLLNALGELKDFVTETAGAAWDRFIDFVAPIGEFFSEVYDSYVAPALDWLGEIGGAVWQGILDFGQTLWDWTEPIRDVAGRVWNWVKEQLFGPDEGGAGEAGGSGGIVAWIRRKAGEAWDWVKERTRPVWEPVVSLAHSVAELLPPPFLARFGERMNALATDLNATDEAVADGDGVAESRDTLASVLPSVQRVIGTLRGVIEGAGAWIADKVGAVGGVVSRLMGALRGSELFSWLANLLGWLESAALQLVEWAQQGVHALFDGLLAAFDFLTPFIEALAGVVRRLIGVLRNLMNVAQLILSEVWNAIPCCIREPLKDFIVNQILARIPVFGQFFSDPTLWPRVRATALRILRQIFVDGDLAGAAWTFFRAVLRVLGLPPELVVQVLAKAAGAIGAILLNPVGFIVNLVRALFVGVSRFFGNIATHLLNGVSGWLFAQVREAGIEPPADFSLRSILGFVLQLLGLTVENIFARLAARLDERTVARLRTMLSVATGVWRFIAILVTQGPAALWEEIQEQLGSLWDRVLDAVINWVTEAVINRATRWLLALLDVTGIMPVINTLIAVYNAIESFVQYLRQLLEIVSRMLDGILGIAQGAIDAAAGYLEDAMGRGMPVVIGFLANQFGLGRLGARIREVVEGVQALVNRAIDWLLDRAIRLGQALIDLARRGATAVRDAAGAVLQWWRRRFGFSTPDGEPHEIYAEGEDAELMLESTPQRYSAFLAALPASTGKTEAQRVYGELQTLRRRARTLAGAAAPAAASSASSDPFTSNDPQVVSAAIVARIEELATLTATLMPAGGGASTPPEFGSVTGEGYGRSVRIDLLNAERAHWPVRGGEPSVSSARWQRLAKRRSDGNAGDHLYVKGHLLNHNLDGPGNLWENLAPITQDANNRGGSSMLHAFETGVKNAVDGGGSARNLVVTMAYGRGNRGAALRDIDGELAGARGARRRELEAMRGVVEEEQHIPSSVSCRAEILDRGGRRTSRLNVTVPNTITTQWRNYTVEP